MFAACPHCQFLVARHPLTRALPPVCPRCGRPLEDAAAAAPASPPSLATYLHASPADASTAATGDASPPAGEAARTATPQDARAPEPAAMDASAGIESDEAPADEPAPDPTHAASSTTAEDAAPVSVGESASDEEGARAAQGDKTDAITSPATIPATASPAATPPAPTRAKPAASPRFTRAARTTPVHARTAYWQWAVVAVLALLLSVQVLVADRARLAMQAGWRPLVGALCGALGCDVPTWREPEAFAMLSRDVRPVPGAPGTLHAQATFRNDARWAQAWPVIVLTLKDADGRTLGARALQPQEYLGGAAPTAAIGPGQSAQVAVRVREPSANVVAFSFDFR